MKKGTILDKHGNVLVGSARAAREIQSRFNTLETFDPSHFTAYIREYKSGHISRLLRAAEDAFDADDQIASVFPKRCRATSQLDWDILKTEESDEADRHAAALEYLFNNCTTTHCLKEDQRGGFKALIKQMMSAVGFEYAMHEIIWTPIKDSAGTWQLTADFRQVPAYFFETTTGRARFLKEQYDIYGEDLEPNRWMVTCAQHSLLRSTLIAYLYKQLPLKDWLILCEKFGFPWVHGKTSAAPDSTQWADFVGNLKALGNDCQIVTDNASEINMEWPGNLGNLPQPALIDRMDRAIATLWRGGDLSTMSKGDAVGATQQQEERENIEADDADMISETLDIYVCRPALKWLFGVDRGLAYIQLKPTERVDTGQERETDTFLIQNGVRLSKKDLAERYNRQIADENEEIAGQAKIPKAAGEPDDSSAEPHEDLENEISYTSQHFERYLNARRKAFAPALKKLAVIGELDPKDRSAALRQLQSELPGLVNIGRETADILEQDMAERMINGAASGQDDTANESSATYFARLTNFFKNLKLGKGAKYL